MFKNKKKYLLLFPLILILLLPATAIAAGIPQQQAGPPPASTNSVTILIDGEQVQGPIAKDDVVHEGERINGKCENPSIAIHTLGDVSKVKIGPDGDTCNLKVKTLELNNTQLSDPNSALLTGPGYKWEVKILSLVEGIPPEFDHLTRTRSKFTFKTPNFTNSGSLFDGADGVGSCWGHYDPPLYYQENERCSLTKNLTSSTKMYHKVVGEYTHEVFESFGHTVTANAIAYGNKNMPKAFGYECKVVSKPWASNLECEFDWRYIGYE